MKQKPDSSYSGQTAGFTLIELMIVVTVLAILGAIAYPNYRNYVIRSARSEAKAALVTLAAKQEQYFQNNKSYTSTLSDLKMNALTENGKYLVSIPAANNNSYTLQAVPQGGQAQDTECANFTLDSRGTKGASGPKGAECW